MTEASLVASLLAPPSLGGEELSALPQTVKWLEVRADLVGDLDVKLLRSRFSGRLLYTLRSRAEGGEFSGPYSERRRRLKKAASQYDIVDLEGERDLRDDLLKAIPPAHRLISWQGSPSGYSELLDRFNRFSKVEAGVYKLVTIAVKTGDELAPLKLLKSLGRSDTIAFSIGHTGFWSRLLAARLGCPLVFGAVRSAPGCRDEPTIAQLIEDYGLPTLAPLESIYGIVGNPVSHSLSPRLHNAAYRELGCPALFVPFQVKSFDDFWREVVTSGALELLGISIKGLTVVSPHKEAAIGSAGASSFMVRQAGSTNIFVRNNGHWHADTTDPEGVVLALKERGIRLERKAAAVIGCGGAGRAIAAALAHAGARVTLVNRGLERAHRAVQLLGLPFIPLSQFSIEGFSIVVNATPVGRDDNRMPFDLADMSEDAVIVDLAYGFAPTPLVIKTLARGGVAIDGREVLRIQVLRQFRMMTGLEIPVGLAGQVLGGNGEAKMKLGQVKPALAQNKTG